MKLISHLNADGDLLEAWFKHYLKLGVSGFHLVVHGPRSDNRRLYELRNRFPIHVEDSYEGVFDVREKKRRVDLLLAGAANAWVVFVDSDEFLELPFRRLSTTVRMMQWAKADVLHAPMLQHLSVDGSLETPETIVDPFETQPLCSVGLYRLMGSQASINKYPLFYCRPDTLLSDGGNHNPPLGCGEVSAQLRATLHHFKFRKCVLDRLSRRIDSAHPFRGESAVFQNHLERHNYLLPLQDTFPYSRRELFRRGLLLRPGFGSLLRKIGINVPA